MKNSNSSSSGGGGGGKDAAADNSDEVSLRKINMDSVPADTCWSSHVVLSLQGCSVPRLSCPAGNMEDKNKHLSKNAH